MQSHGSIIFNQPDKPEQSDQGKETTDATQDGLMKMSEHSPEKAAEIEVTKEIEKGNVASHRKLDSLVDKVREKLYVASTVFPFTFFPTTVVVRPDKVDIIFQEFFWSEHIHTTMVQDITDITVQTSLFFGTLIITDQGFHDKTITVSYLKKSDALNLRRIIQGLVVLKNEKVDATYIEKDLLIERLHQLGQARAEL